MLTLAAQTQTDNLPTVSWWTPKFSVINSVLNGPSWCHSEAELWPCRYYDTISSHQTFVWSVVTGCLWIIGLWTETVSHYEVTETFGQYLVCSGSWRYCVLKNGRDRQTDRRVDGGRGQPEYITVPTKLPPAWRHKDPKKKKGRCNYHC